ncbi:MAG: hypothetical protein RL688_1795 [Actinomycetota bacterium]
MSRLGLAVHRFRPDALEVAGRVIGWASANGYEVVADESDLASLRSTSVTSGDVGDVDVLVSIGGDGTMLRSVHVLNGRVVPLIGVNLGQLGYLAVVEVDDVVGNSGFITFSFTKVNTWDADQLLTNFYCIIFNRS